MINTSSLKRGQMIELEGAPWLVVECAFQTPSARGASTITKAKIRNVITGAVLKKSWRGGEMLPEADCEKRPAQFLYKSGEEFWFMDEESYEQFQLTADLIGDAAGFLLEGMPLKSMLFNGEVVSIELPATIDLLVTETTPNMKGATAQAQLKSAIVETGITIQVPPYLESGTRIRVDTRDGRFIERVKSSD